MNISPIGERIKAIIKNYGVTQQKFAEDCAMSSANLSNLLSGKVKEIGSSYLTNLAQKYKAVNLRWLLTGEESMLIDGIDIGYLNANRERTTNLELIQNYTELTKIHNKTVKELADLQKQYLKIQLKQKEINN